MYPCVHVYWRYTPCILWLGINSDCYCCNHIDIEEWKEFTYIRMVYVFQLGFLLAIIANCT